MLVRDAVCTATRNLSFLCLISIVLVIKKHLIYETVLNHYITPVEIIREFSYDGFVS